ncbi:MAG: DNA polymerase I [Cyanobacteria bacterium]|nr:DNA polymerase I [Cyanobacteria bacterium CG_2015-16_32_12]NCO77343.1 DNA polymerase I [Cyanobacteria bacterium CG_2015-22_32_23]NCQ04124.1 DNA polymerase I [Cyanobacteria bacterium CG_2015-09_32_10]NCQ42541.1 DNA polymerase I [Cyanobacteria bacterium CG_2015-04_32_10]NCS83879.1 DNA polymerase I [Cyanobacteria bacterium CG_2015-02_32_10]
MNYSQTPLFLIVDGHSLAYRAYYALAKAKKGPLRTSKGIPTSVCFGFLNSLLQIITDYQPQFIAIAFDLKQPTFRHEADSNYKSDRQETPSDFIEDVYNLQELLTSLNIKIVTAIGYEADDVIGTLATQAVTENYQVKILSGDRDLFQLVNDEQQVTVLYLERSLGKYEIYDEEAVFTKMKVKPHQIVDYKALCGDKSDCIPGVLGIGEKIASNLFAEYDSLTDIYNNLDKIKGGIQNKLIKGKQEALHSQYLAQIITDIGLNISLEDFKLTGFNNQKVIPLLENLELHSFVKQLNKIQETLGGNLLTILRENNENNDQQLSLFSAVTNNNQITPFIVDSITKLEEFIKIIKQVKITAWDTETDSLNTQQANLIGIGCAWGKNRDNVAYIPIKHSQGKQLSLEEIKLKLQPILENSGYPKTLQNAKFDRLVLLTHGINLQGVVFDTMLASYVLQPEESHKLSSLCYQYSTNFIAQDYDDLNLDKKESIDDLTIEKVAEYCGLDVLATFELTEILSKKLGEIPPLKSVFELELKLEPILAKMQEKGVIIDQEYLQQLAKEIDNELINIEKSVYEEVGEFNLASPKQLSELLFEELGLDKRKSTKTKTGYSTNQSILEKLKGDHPIIESILQHRTLAKLKSTYVDSLPTLINPKTNRIHTNYNQTVTATGRLSSSNPNLQNIPIRTAFSRQIRKGFIPQKNWQFLAADYSQIELRILAHLSQEPILISAYQNHQDIHTVTAQLFLNKQDITAEERNLGKTINFGIIYGMGAQKFARESNLSVAEAQKFISIYREKYAQVFNYLETMKKEALVNGYVTTILGRRRYFNFNDHNLDKLKGEDINSIDLSSLKFNNYTSQLLRAAANAPIQGSSADIIKLAMIKVDEILTNYQGKLLMQVHDELVFELPLEEIAELNSKIKEIMENIITLKVPLIVDIHSGNNWMEAK